MKNAKRKDFAVEIGRSRNRFLSILFIVALGVAFFSGIRASRPDMELSADRYYDDTKLMDIRIVGTLGLTDGDVEAVRRMDGVRLAQGAYTADVLCEIEGREQSVRVFSLTEEVNRFTVTEGRLPEASGECLMDRGKIYAGGAGLGETVTVYSGTDDELSDTLNRDTYTIVGIGTSSRYLSLDRGTTTVGDGSLDGFMVVTPENFALEVYTDLYVLTEKGEQYVSYSDEYDDYIEKIADNIEDTLSEERSRIRYEEVVEEADEKLNDAREELADKSREADEKLADAAAEIADAEQTIEEGKEDLEQGQKDLDQGKQDLADAEKKLADGKQTLKEKEQELRDAKATLEEKEQELRDAKATLEEKEQELSDAKVEVPKKERELERAKKKFEQQSENARMELEDGWREYEYGMEDYEAAEEELKGHKEELKEAWKEFREMSPGLDPAVKQAMEAQLRYQDEALREADRQLAVSERQLRRARQELHKGQQKLDKAEADIADGEQKLEEAKQKITDGEQQVADAHRDMEEADQKIADAHRDIEDGERKLADARADIRDGEEKIPKAKEDIAKGEADLLDAREKLADGERELADAKIKYEDARTEAAEKIADAQEKIDDAQADIDELEQGEWYVLDRGAIQTYVEFGSDAERIGAIGDVFPFIFFLVAALVSLTTMTRMVEEQRLQIGTLKALGYGKWSIASKYILYAFLATLAGSILGVAAGEKILPYVIMTAYFILYENLPVMLTPYHAGYALTASGLALGCTVLATMSASYKELLSSPAALMRPVPPKQGKRVLLESIKPLWRRLGFIQKATVRNLFRYKKRCLMTIFGIGGCMALLLVGFGLQDSISTLGEKQYDDIWTYDVQMGLEEEAEDEEKQKLEEKLDAEGIGARLRVRESILDVTGNDVTKEASLFVPETVDLLGRFVHLRDRLSGKPYEMDDSGVVITEKLAALLSVEPGDTIWLKEDEDTKYPVVVTAVAENYLRHYVYMTPALYRELCGEEVQYNTMFLGLDGEDRRPEEGQPEETWSEETLGSELLSCDAVTSVVFIGTMRGQISDMLDSLDVVIWVLIISAGMLAFVVVYNLNNININERLRELATIRVLGFYDMELAAYVYRENVILTILGSAAGAVMGFFLHRYVVLTVEVDMLMFGRQIRPLSYGYSILLTCLFSAMVNGLMYFKLRKIDMVESLKSVE